MLDYVIGMDGGGTKTEICIAGTDKSILVRFRGGAINYNGGSKALVDANIRMILQRIREEGYRSGECAGICIGAAGISNPVIKTRIEEIIRKNGFTSPVSIVGDDVTAFAGALEDKEGIVLIAGTGSICHGRDLDGKTYRAGGYGHIIDDAGSGYAIARDILAAVVRAQDGRGEETALTDMVFRYLKIESIEEMIGYLYSPGRNKREIAQLSVLIQDAFTQKDPAAVPIVQKAANDLTELAGAVIKRMKRVSRLAVSGSVLLKNEDIYKEFVICMKNLYPDIGIIRPLQDAAYGAVLLALKLTQQEVTPTW